MGTNPRKMTITRVNNGYILSSMDQMMYEGEAIPGTATYVFTDFEEMVGQMAEWFDEEDPCLPRETRCKATHSGQRCVEQNGHSGDHLAQLLTDGNPNPPLVSFQNIRDLEGGKFTELSLQPGQVNFGSLNPDGTVSKNMTAEAIDAVAEVDTGAKPAESEDIPCLSTGMSGDNDLTMKKCKLNRHHTSKHSWERDYRPGPPAPAG